MSGPSGKIPVVALTASAMAGDRERCLEAGMDAYLSKFLNPIALADLLVQVTGSAGPDPHPRNAAAKVERLLDREVLDGLRRLDPHGR